VVAVLPGAGGGLNSTTACGGGPGTTIACGGEDVATTTDGGVSLHAASATTAAAARLDEKKLRISLSIPEGNAGSAGGEHCRSDRAKTQLQWPAIQV
jgi:hypothetical protein